ncbi:hypothetical protein Tco_0862882 [Tanacetum coccineum]
MVFHNEDGNPARANIKQALGYLKDGDGDGNSQPHKGVKASANSDVMYSFTSAQDGDPLQDDVRLCLGDDLKKAQDHSQRQACMLAIFHEMIEESVGVFMDDFSVFGNSFDDGLNNIDKMIQRCLEVDKAKIDVISKLPPPTNVKGIRSFL